MRRTAAPRAQEEPAVRPLLLLATANSPLPLSAALVTALEVAFGDHVAHVPDFAADRTNWGDDAGDITAARIALGLFPLDACAEFRTFEQTARARGLRALGLSVESSLVLVGPMSDPAAPGCGYCARLRMLGAAAARGVMTSDAEHASQLDVLRYLVNEIRRAVTARSNSQRLRHHVVAIDPNTGARHTHRVVPMPYCQVCGGAAAMNGVRSQRGLDGWVDPITGVIAMIGAESPRDTGLASPIVVTASPPHLVTDDGEVRQLPVGWGKGLTPGDAVLSAVGEAVERYSASMPDRSTIVETRARDLDGPHLDPSRFPLYTAEQYARPGFPFARYDPDLPQPWVRGVSLQTRKPIWVHGAFVHLSLRLRRHQLIVQGSSNGLAASRSLDDAALRATLELVERDALLRAWMTGSPGRRVMLDDALDADLHDIVTGVEQLGAAVELYLLDSAVGTTAMCVSLGDGREWPGATIALGAALQPMTAIRAAILELGQTGPHLRRMLQRQTRLVPGDAAAVHDMLDHATYFFPAERQEQFDAIRRGGSTVALADLVADDTPATISTLRAAAAAGGLEVVIVDVTSPDVRTGPFRVARAISPDLQGLSYGFGLTRAPVTRVREAQTRRAAAPVHPIW